MNPPFETSAAVLLLFVVRLGIPLALSLLLAWGLHCLDRHWQAKFTLSQPAAGVSPAVTETGQPTPLPGLVDRPCWEYRACPDATRGKCPAGCGGNVVCWLARLRQDGRLPAQCRTCAIFTTTTPWHAVTGGAD